MPRRNISGNTSAGVYIAWPNANGNSVEGNVIGLAADGVTPLGNGLSGSGVTIGDPTSGNRVGGTAPGQGNRIAGNVINVNVDGDAAVVQGNIIGLNAAGGAAGGVLGVNVSATAGSAISARSATDSTSTIRWSLVRFQASASACFGVSA